MARLVDIIAEDQAEDEQTSCEAMLLFWYHSEGDSVEADQDMAEIETAKAVVVVKAPETGVVKEILVHEGDAVDPGAKLAVLECAD